MHGSNDAPTSATRTPSTGSGATAVTTQVQDVTQLAFAISLTLANLHGSVDADAMQHVERAIGQLDDLVGRLRLVGLELSMGRDPVTPSTGSADGSAPDGQPDPIDQAARTLRAAADTIAALWIRALPTSTEDGAVPRRLTDASQHLRRATASLDDSNLR